jgi:hypothetical protein
MTKKRAHHIHGRGLRGLLVLALLVFGGLAGGSAPASAASPCWAQVLNDWFVDGRIDNTYPVSCYTQATQHLGEDAVNYSGAPDDIRRALLAAIRGDKADGGPSAPGASGSGSGGSGGSGSGPSSGSGGSGGSSGSGGTPAAPPTNQGPIQKAIDWVGPSNAESIPLPLLVLAGIALLLLAAAAASFAARRLQARRVPPAAGPRKPL